MTVKEFQKNKAISAVIETAQDAIKKVAGIDVRLMCLPAIEDSKTPYELIRVICAALDLTVEDIREKGRQRWRADARFICCHLLKEIFPTIRVEDIAKLVGYGEDHTLACSAIDSCENLLFTKDEMFTIKYGVAQKEVTAWLSMNLK